MNGFDNISVDQLVAEHDALAMVDALVANGYRPDRTHRILIGGSVAQGEAQYGDDIKLFFVASNDAYRRWVKKLHSACTDDAKRRRMLYACRALDMDAARVGHELGRIGRDVDTCLLPKDFRNEEGLLIPAPDLAILHEDERRSLFIA